jgi:hypothetical protein
MGLARETSNDAIQLSTPFQAIECGEGGPDGGAIQPSISHTGKEYRLSERVFFAVESWLPAELLGSKVESCDA